MPPKQRPAPPVQASNLGILSDLASRQQPSQSPLASTSQAFDPFRAVPAARSLGGVGVGAGVGIDTTMAPAQRIYSPSRARAGGDGELGEEDSTPVLNAVGLHEVDEEGEGGGRHEVDFNFFGTTRGFDTVAATATDDTGGVVNGDKGKGRMQEDMTDSQRAGLLMEMDASADASLAASSRYQTEILAVMAKLSSAMTRTEELHDVMADMHAELATGQLLRVAAPGTVQVTLPWFKHFHGRDLPPNEDGEARDRYLAAIRHVPWTPSEKKLLRGEVVSQNNREVAMMASLNGEDMEEKLASYDPSYFLESTELLDWEKIALVIPRRSPVECKIQWLQKDHPRINHGPWSHIEIQRLCALAAERHNTDWEGIAEALGTKRTVAACIKQFRRKSVERKEWTTEEDTLLKEGVRLYGANWQSVALLVGRHSNQCINRWSKTVRDGIKKGKWLPEEDEQLRAAVKACGVNWKEVEKHVVMRTDAQCRERWVNILDPRILPRHVWSEEEDEILMRAKDEDGHSWSAISHIFGGRRTDNHCMRRYAEIKRQQLKQALELDAAIDDDADPDAHRVPAAKKKKRKPRPKKKDAIDPEDDLPLDPDAPLDPDRSEPKARKYRKTDAGKIALPVVDAPAARQGGVAPALPQVGRPFLPPVPAYVSGPGPVNPAYAAPPSALPSIPRQALVDVPPAPIKRSRNVAPPKRGVGRPRKHPIVVIDPSIPPPPKRPVGRPKKVVRVVVEGEDELMQDGQPVASGSGEVRNGLGELEEAVRIEMERRELANLKRSRSGRIIKVKRG